MKKPTNYFKLLILFCLMCSAKIGLAQLPCSISLSPNVGAGGNVTFYTSASATSSTSPNTYTWNYGNGSVVTGTNLVTGAMTYTANGTYVVSVTYSSSAASCSATATQTVVITNANGCGLAVGFYSTVGPNGLVTFQNNSQNTAGGATYTWIFGDGSPNGSGTTVPHTYATTGTSYTVKLIINNNSTPACIDSATSVVYACGPPPVITSTTNLNGSVTFSVGVTGGGTLTTAMWNFGANPNNYNGGSSPTFTYLANGNYTVTFMGGVGVCTTTVIYPINVSNVTAPCNILANFYPSNQAVNGAVTFVNYSSGISGSVTYLWSFGDNSTSTAVTPPVHTYSANGTYIATLTANNNFSYTCASTATQAIVIYGYCNTTAGFNASIGANGGVSFANTSTGATGYTWNFGDGSPNSTLNSPAHTYANGTYNVILTATGNASTLSACSSTLMQVVTVTTCIADASFSMTPTGTPQYWNAYPLFPSNVSSASWNWGDNSSSSTLYTSHTFSAAGTYDICLTVTVNCGSINTYCFPYAIFKSANANQNMDIIQVTVIDPATVGIKNNAADKVDYTISPNPTSGLFNLNLKGLNSGNANVSVYNLVGKLIYQTEVETSNGNIVKEVQLDQVSNGVYFVKVSADNKVFTQKLILNKQ